VAAGSARDSVGRNAGDGDVQGSPISERSKKVLEFERQWWKHAGAKEEAIRSEFGLSAARYYQMLNTVLDEPQALAFDPMLVKRLHRIRDARTEARASRADHHH
jgi:hypothetical protein